MKEKALHDKKIRDFEIRKVTVVSGVDTEAEKRAYIQGILEGSKNTISGLKVWAIAVVRICEKYLRKEIKRSQLPKWIKKLDLNDEAIAGLCLALRDRFELKKEEDLK